MLRMHSVTQVLGYTVSGLMMVAGVLILTGIMVPVFVQTGRYRMWFGVVVLLFGIFRFITVYFKRNPDDLEQDDSWKSGSSTSSSSPPLP